MFIWRWVESITFSFLFFFFFFFLDVFFSLGWFNSLATYPVIGSPRQYWRGGKKGTMRIIKIDHHKNKKKVFSYSIQFWFSPVISTYVGDTHIMSFFIFIFPFSSTTHYWLYSMHQKLSGKKFWWTAFIIPVHSIKVMVKKLPLSPPPGRPSISSAHSDRCSLREQFHPPRRSFVFFFFSFPFHFRDLFTDTSMSMLMYDTFRTGQGRGRKRRKRVSLKYYGMAWAWSVLVWWSYTVLWSVRGTVRVQITVSAWKQFVWMGLVRSFIHSFIRIYVCVYVLYGMHVCMYCIWKEILEAGHGHGWTGGEGGREGKGREGKGREVSITGSGSRRSNLLYCIVSYCIVSFFIH